MTSYAVFQNNILQNERVCLNIFGGNGKDTGLQQKSELKMAENRHLDHPIAQSKTDHGWIQLPWEHLQMLHRHLCGTRCREDITTTTTQNTVKHSPLPQEPKVHQVKSNNEKQLFALSQ